MRPLTGKSKLQRMNYTHLTEDERYQIKEWHDERVSQSEIAARLKRAPSTVSRELTRNMGERGYRPRQAQLKAQDRKKNNHGQKRISIDIWAEIEEQLKLDHSPEQVCGSRKLNGLATASHESIYLYVYADKDAGGRLHKHLRCQKKKRKRYGNGGEKRGQIRNRKRISERPLIVEARSREGDWEGDTVQGKQESQSIVTLVERKTRFMVARKVVQRKADQVRNAIISGFACYDGLVHTITFDNGKEFALHDEIATALTTAIYFADPYASWQRGLNENHNGLLRQYIPKSISLDELTEEQLQDYVDKLNDRPRKCLGYQTPRQVMLAEAMKLGVALPH